MQCRGRLRKCLTISQALTAHTRICLFHSKTMLKKTASGHEKPVISLTWEFLVSTSG